MFTFGLDLAAVQDYCGLSVVRSDSGPDGKRKHFCGGLDRWRKSYPDTVEFVAGLARRHAFRNATLVCDQTGVGRPVVDMLRAALPGRRVIGVTITAGSGWSRGEHKDDLRVSKKLLCSTLQVLLSERRMSFAGELPLAPVLESELANFRVKVTPNANETFEAWRERDHDDLVLSLALAAFVADNGPKPLTDARVANAVLNPLPLSGRDLAAGEGVRSRLEELAEDLPHVFAGD